MKMTYVTKLIASSCLIFLFTSCMHKDHVDYVNPRIGTAYGGAGGTYIGCAVPFAKTWFGPMTNQNEIGRMPYYFDEWSLCGFMATHQPTVWMGDYGQVSFMPEVENLRIDLRKRGCLYHHKFETAHPYYYAVKYISDTYRQSEIMTEVTSSLTCGFFRIRYPSNSSAYLVIDATRDARFRGYLEIDTVKNEVRGYNNDRFSAIHGPALPNFKGYFIMKFNTKISGTKTFYGDSVVDGAVKAHGRLCGGVLQFNLPEGGDVSMRLATSFISFEQAEKNLSLEIPEWDFEGTAKKNKDAWNDVMSRVELEGATDDEKTIFYTALYHCLLLPRIFSEHGRYYSAFDDTVHDGVSYNDYSLWDTYRAQHPLLIFLTPEHVGPMITSLLQMYKEGGWLPKWPNPTYSNIMIGTHADAVIADAMVKGFRNFDTNLAWEAIRKDAFVPPYGDSGNSHWVRSPWDTVRPKDLPKEAGNPWWDRESWHGYEARAGLTWVMKYGYVPCDLTSESVSNTLEGAYDDYCVAQVAKIMGKKKEYEVLMKRSTYYKNVYNPSTGFMAARLSNGRWLLDTMKKETMGPEQYIGFTEGGPWTYLFCVMQDMPGLIGLMGGNEKFAKKLDRNFNEDHYRHDNEPGHHYIYLYDYCGQPWKTQELARKHTHINYRNRPDGINGNDDCGQMSAWYVFSCMGFYPVCPGSDEYAVGAPQFREMSIALGNGRELTIVARNLSEKNQYVQSLTINGEEIHTPFIKHSQIAHGAEVVFVMGPEPEMKWFK